MPGPRPPVPFVVGVGRSGTTLLRLMLDAHSDLAIPAETHFLPAVARRRLLPLSPQKFLEIVTSAETWPNLGLEESALCAAVFGLAPFSATAAVRRLYLLYAQRFGKTRWGDKTPPYRAHLRTIAGLVPEAHFVHVIRDGRDVALSYRGLWFGPGDDLEAQATFWVAEIERTRRDAHRVDNYAEVRYEELVTDPEAVLRRICDFLALDFEARMLDYHETAATRLAEYRQPFGPKRPPDIESFLRIHERVTQAPDPGRVGRWRTAVTADEQRRYEAIAGPLLRDLGYETGRIRS